MLSDEFEEHSIKLCCMWLWDLGLNELSWQALRLSNEPHLVELTIVPFLLKNKGQSDAVLIYLQKSIKHNIITFVYWKRPKHKTKKLDTFRQVSHI